MSFNMGNATYGRDREAIIQLIGSYNTTLANTRRRLKGDMYAQLLKTIDEYWSGADAQSFKTAIEKEISAVQKQIDNYQKKIGDTLMQSYTDFTKFQSSNTF